MHIIYTAGAITPLDGSHETLWRNLTKARNIARKLWSMGWAVVCPQMNTFMMDGEDISPDIFYGGDNEIIRRCCDAMLMLPGWEDSKGARYEEALAKELGLDIYYDITQVPEESKYEPRRIGD